MSRSAFVLVLLLSISNSGCMDDLPGAEEPKDEAGYEVEGLAQADVGSAFASQGNLTTAIRDALGAASIPETNPFGYQNPWGS